MYIQFNSILSVAHSYNGHATSSCFNTVLLLQIFSFSGHWLCANCTFRLLHEQKLGVKAPPVRIDSQAKYGALSRGDGAIYLRFPHRGYREKIWDHAAGSIVVTGVYFSLL